MLPVAIALIGTGLRPQSIAFMGWFGPRGIATIALLLVAAGDEPGLGDWTSSSASSPPPSC